MARPLAFLMFLVAGIAVGIAYPRHGAHWSHSISTHVAP
jgi:hypothetical protein